LATPLSGGMAPVFQSLGLDLIGNQLETNDYKAALLEPPCKISKRCKRWLEGASKGALLS
jgi:hypothetical protein